ncbi:MULTISPECIES: urease accessory protein UreF [Hymenobacter]|uniref:Urease accessory protein UreF n=1 Tax=Hymenobacter mucosus TaxID=1411120 RepID=A0A238W7D0_9BACT|nr:MULTISPECIES: urease accessory UreF family protein [Hymenobacter]SNR42418.1 urease accessory protein [Hymenobacter mucosus]
MTQFARLLHLVDSSIPTGSFAYSYGLEASITFGLVTNAFGLRNYLYAYLQQVSSMELPVMTSCFRLAGQELGNEFLVLAEEYDAQMLVPALHKASVVQGRNWLKLLVSFYPTAGLQALGEWFVQHQQPQHFTLLFTLALQKAGFQLPDLQTMYLHMLLRDQLSAAIRLGFLGPLEGHRLQHDFYTVFEELLAAQASKEYQDACRSAFLLDTAQVLHEDLYSKLFQN